jgi:hypothetical protein
LKLLRRESDSWPGHTGEQSPDLGAVSLILGKE